MKALHPSDHEIKATRVPGGTDNTVAIAIDQIMHWTPEDPAKPVRFALMPNMMRPLIIQEGSAQGWTTTGNFEPPAFGGRGLATSNPSEDKMREFFDNVVSNFEAVRITSESLTINFVAPATANQGTVVSAQFPLMPQDFWLNQAAVNQHNTIGMSTYGMPSTLYGTERVMVYDHWPEKAELMSGTRAYSSQAIDGVYVPLRIGPFDWKSIGRHAIKGRYFIQDEPNVPRDLIGGTNVFEAFDFQGFTWGNADVFDGRGCMVLADFANTMSITQFDGTSTDSSYELRFRMTVECRVRPGSTYAPMALPPPVPDELALKMYPEIAGRMKNAYPARYNDWDTLKKTIKSIGHQVLRFSDPLIHLVTSGLPMGGAISSLATSVTDGLRKKLAEDGEMTKEDIAREAQAAAIAKAISRTQARNSRKIKSARARANKPQLDQKTLQALQSLFDKKATPKQGRGRKRSGSM